MDFTYDSYKDMIKRLKRGGYDIVDYHNYANHKKCAILRHDIDCSIEKAVCFARIEKELGVKSTYFVLLTTDFYNVFSKKSRDELSEILSCGHELGLHYDELAYVDGSDVVSGIIKEAGILGDVIGQEVTTVSMHMPSQRTLKANYVIAGGRIVNSYGDIFFKNFKYVSDSMMRWREDVDGYIETGRYDKLHILTHAASYAETKQDVKTRCKNLILRALDERYELMKVDMPILEGMLTKEELLKS